jgi:hypothetical protein
MLLVKHVLERVKKYPNVAHKSAVDELCDKIVPIIEISKAPDNKINFLKTLVDDYVILSR